MTKLRVVAEGLSKRYKLGILGSLFRKPKQKKEMWALEDVSLDVEGGEALGVIGRNGAGKSTLLKVLCGVTTPTRGTVERPKRVVPLIELTAGFHPELTGRDNVFLNGALLGMGRRELEKRLDAIVDFSGVEAFLDTPAKKYSSGMLVRLAFSTAIHVDPELLLIDEVLSVGDLNFSLKAERATTKLRQAGVPMVVVSHNLGQIRNASTKAIWLDGGKVMARGKPDEVIAAYTRGIYSQSADASEGESYRTHSDPTVAITKVEILNAKGETPPAFETGEPLTLRVHYETQRATEPLELYIAFYNAETGAMLMDHNTRNDGVFHTGTTGPSVGVGVMHLPRQPFHAGRYRISVILAENHPDIVADWHEKMYGFAVGGGRVGYGVFHAFPEWRFEPVQPTVNG